MRSTAVAGGLLAAALVASACGTGIPESEMAIDAETAIPTAVDPGDSQLDAGCEPYAAYFGHEGTSVTLSSAVVGPDQQAYEDAWAPFEDCTGIDVVYEGSRQFETDLPSLVTGGTAPDLAWIQRPGLIAELVRAGGPVPAPQGVAENVSQYWSPAWKDYASVDSVLYGAPNSANVDSLVWYSPTLFAENGYEIPTTWDEMIGLSDRMAKDGVKPWCGGLESGETTGWPATDWLEQVVLRQEGGEIYDQWVAGAIKFSSPEIAKSMDTLANWMKNPKYVNGGFGDVKTIAATSSEEAGRSILEGTCGMLQQGSSYTPVWADINPDAYVAEDGDVFAFALPPMGEDVAPVPVVGGGDFTVAFADRPEVQAVQTYLSSPEFATSRAAQPGSWVSANNGVPPELYFDPVAAIAAMYLTDQTVTFKFDASELMPSPVGANAFPTQMTAWFADSKSTAEVAAEIDAAWPTR